ncbi:S41 family peptidase [Spirosoma jeollabukense]
MAIFRTKTLSLVALLLLSYLISCNPTDGPSATSSEAQLYVQEVVNYMQSHSINRKNLNWTTFKQQVTSKAQGARSIADTYPAIKMALTLLGDNYSTYITSDGTIIKGVTSLTCTDSPPTDVTTHPAIGYVKITGFTGSDAEATTFAQSIQSSIKQRDSDFIRGWIVDLRGNSGGNMWPMLAGIGPILGEGVVGYFIDPEGATSSWSYQKGVAKLDQTDRVKIDNPYTLHTVSPRVAVLTDRATASSGEAIAIAFKGRPATRSFGVNTCGVATANIDTLLSDGARLTLTQSTMADRSKRLYITSVQPDEVLVGAAAVDKAMSWLLQ